MKLITNLNNKELAVCQTLKKLGQASVAEIAKNSGLKRTTVYNFIGRLGANKLIGQKQINGKSIYFMADDNPLFVPIVRNFKPDAAINFIITRRALKNEVLKTLKSGANEVLWLADSRTTTDILGNRFFEKYIETAKNKGIILKTLRSSLSRGSHRYHSDKSIIESGRIVRRGQTTMPFESSLVIYGRKVLIISRNNQYYGYVINDQQIAATFLSIFKNL